MRSRREQIRAYRFVTRRIVAALLGADPETSEPPMRRAGLTLFASAMIGALVLAGFGVYGLARPGGSSSWRQAGVLIVEKDTGTRFVYRDGRLHPVLNYASARLLLGAARPDVVSVSADSLSGVPRGRPVGIADAPDAVPGTDALVGLPWTVCAARTPDSVAHDPIVTLLVGGDYPGRQPLGDRGVLVSAHGTGTWLVWHGTRLHLGGRVALASLNWAARTVTTVAPAFLNALPAGPDLAAPTIPHAGSAGPAVAGSTGTVGTVYQVTSPAGTQYEVLLSDGLAPISEVTADLLLGEAGRTTAVTLSPTQQSAVPPSATDMKPDGVPEQRPDLTRVADDVGPALCAGYGTGGRTTVAVYPHAPAAVTDRDPAAANGTGALGTLTATAVVVPGGHGALVRATAAPGVPTGPLYLVTDQGLRYAIADGKARTALGYSGASPVLVPEDLLDLIPTGPVLKVSAASRYSTGVVTPSPNRK
jgi:ESX secretion system ATPase EccB